jgi:hypothetical protein
LFVNSRSNHSGSKWPPASPLGIGKLIAVAQSAYLELVQVRIRPPERRLQNEMQLPD